MPPPIETQLNDAFSNRIDLSEIEITQVLSKTSEDEICRIVSGATVILCPPIRKISRRILESARGVKLFQTASVGYGFIDMEAVTEFKIPVANNPGYSTTSVAEHTIMFMLVLLKKALKAHEPGTRKNRTINEVFGIWDSVWELGKTLGILGRGNIGKEVAKLAKAFAPTTSLCIQSSYYR